VRVVVLRLGRLGDELGDLLVGEGLEVAVGGRLEHGVVLELERLVRVLAVQLAGFLVAPVRDEVEDLARTVCSRTSPIQSRMSLVSTWRASSGVPVRKTSTPWRWW
jgi:hypothetical protein